MGGGPSRGFFWLGSPPPRESVSTNRALSELMRSHQVIVAAEEWTTLVRSNLTQLDTAGGSEEFSPIGPDRTADRTLPT